MSGAVFIDETKHRNYVVVAAVVVPGELAALRRTVRGLVLPRQRRVHMTKESAPRRRLIADTIVRSGVTVVVFDAGDAYLSELDARQACLRGVISYADYAGASRPGQRGAAAGDPGCDRLVLVPKVAHLLRTPPTGSTGHSAITPEVLKPFMGLAPDRYEKNMPIEFHFSAPSKIVLVNFSVHFQGALMPYRMPEEREPFPSPWERGSGPRPDSVAGAPRPGRHIRAGELTWPPGAAAPARTTSP